MRTFLIMLLLGFGLAGLTPLSQASLFDKKTTLIFNDRVEIPGMVLEPGKYIVERTNMGTHPDIVTFWNADKTHVYATVKAWPVYRETSAENVIVKFAERPGDAPQALKTLFYPGDRIGEEFIYRTTTVAKLGNLPTPKVSGTLQSIWEPAVCRNDWNKSLEFDLCFRQLMETFRQTDKAGE